MPLPPFISAGARRDPRSIPNLTLWLDASDSTTLFDATSGGSLPPADGAVARWVDKGPSAFQFTQSTANNRPLRRAGNLHGLDGVQFDGVNDLLYASANVFDTGVAVLCVFKLASATARAPVFDLGNYATAGNSFTFEANTYNTAGSRFGFYTANAAYDSTATTSTAATVLTLSANATSGNGVVANTVYRKNGVAATISATSGGPNFGNNAATSGTMLGSFNSNGSSAGTWGNSTLYELVVWNRQLTNAELAFVEFYAAQKWGVPL